MEENRQNIGESYKKRTVDCLFKLVRFITRNDEHASGILVFCGCERKDWSGGNRNVVLIVSVRLVVRQFFRVGNVVGEDRLLPNKTESDVTESRLPLSILPRNIPMNVPL